MNTVADVLVAWLYAIDPDALRESAVMEVCERFDFDLPSLAVDFIRIGASAALEQVTGGIAAALDVLDEATS